MAVSAVPRAMWRPCASRLNIREFPNVDDVHAGAAAFRLDQSSGPSSHGRALVPAPNRDREHLRDSKHGSALGHLPSGYPQLNNVWMWGALLATSIAGWLHQLTATTHDGRHRRSAESASTSQPSTAHPDPRADTSTSPHGLTHPLPPSPTRNPRNTRPRRDHRATNLPAPRTSPPVDHSRPAKIDSRATRGFGSERWSDCTYSRLTNKPPGSDRSLNSCSSTS